MNEKGTQGTRGFASMDRQLQRQIASKGGKAAHEKRTAHEFSTEEARAAGRKGGQAVSTNRQHMAAIGRQGGLARRANRQSGRHGGAPPDGLAAPAHPGSQADARRDDLATSPDVAAAHPGNGGASDRSPDSDRMAGSSRRGDNGKSAASTLAPGMPLPPPDGSGLMPAPHSR